MKKNISIILLFIFVFNSCSKDVKQEVINESKFVTTKTMQEQTFNDEVKLIGKVSSSKEAVISPLVSGTVSRVNFDVGDKVFAGDILAFLDTQSNMAKLNYENALTSYNNTSSIYDLGEVSMSRDLESAKLNYENALINRNNIYKTADNQLQLAQNSADLASISNQNTNSIVKSNLELQQKSLENAKLNLANFTKQISETQKSLATKESNLYKNIANSITQALSSVDNSLLFIDPILGITDANKDKNDSYDYFLGALNSSLKTEAKTDFLKLYYSYNDLQKSWNENLGDNQKKEYLQKIIDLVNRNIDLYNTMTAIFENSVTSVGNLSEAQLNSFKSQNNSLKQSIFQTKSSLLSLDSSLTDLQNSISSTNTNKDTQLLVLNQAVSIAESAYNNALNSTKQTGDSSSFGEKNALISLDSSESNIETQKVLADKNLEIAKNQLDSTRAKLESQLFGTKTQLDNISGQMRLANQTLENSFLRVPFTGVVISKNISAGDFVSPGSKTFVVADLASKIVKLDISQDNAKYLQVGKKVSIEKNGTTFIGTISVLSAGVDPNTKMFKAEVVFDAKSDLASINYGEFIDVYIVKESSKEKYLILPFSAIIVDSMQDNFVFVVGSGSIVEQNKVELGETNNREVIVKSGLKIGDKVVINGASDLSIGDKIME